jgi:L-arabinose isomerase
MNRPSDVLFNASQTNSEPMPTQPKKIPASPRTAKASGATPVATTIDFAPLEAWFVTGSQHLYGPETLAQVESQARQVFTGLSDAGLPIRLVFKPVVTTPDQIRETLVQASAAPNCVGVVVWMHTFSPARMWIGGLTRLTKPLCHLHTQYGRDIPWSSIDMDFMNLNQSAHGDREFGHICARLRIRRKVIVGHWKEKGVAASLAVWLRAAAGWAELRHLKVARLGDNMRQVAVTEGDKVEAEVKFGVSVNGYGLGDLVKFQDHVTDAEIDRLCSEYDDSYQMMPGLKKNGARRESLRDAARIELALRAFLADGGFKAFTDTFENLTGLKQLPGIGPQRLMAEGYGFGAEGDWKHSALVRAMKVMAHGLAGGTSFMEDYTYHFDPAGPAVLGAHMLEICPSIAKGRPSCEVHPLGIGGKEDPVRLVFDSQTGDAINASLVDLGDRFRMIVNKVKAVTPPQKLPKLPVARVLWKPEPDLAIGAAAWIYAGGAHHTAFSLALTPEYIEDFTEMAGIEYLLIDSETRLRQFRDEIRLNDSAWS